MMSAPGSISCIPGMEGGTPGGPSRRPTRDAPDPSQDTLTFPERNESASQCARV
jgi:hypothetical protein